jgi:type IV pilus assembly protein PilM
MDLGWERSFKLEIDQREVFGLDIGSSSVCAIQLQKKGSQWSVTAGGRVKISPSEGVRNLHEINTVRAINECLELTGIRTRFAVCGISGPEVAVRDFKFPSLPSDEIESAVMLEATQVCPFNADDITIDYQLVRNGKDNVSGILVAATNQLISSKVELAKQAALDCVLMDVDGLALLNCLSGCEQNDAGQTTAILNVGNSHTTLAIMSGEGKHALPFIRDVAFAGNDIAEAVANEQDMSPETVKEIVLGDSTAEQPELDNSLEKACEGLVVDVTETLRYYAAQEKSSLVEKIFVCGGFAAVKGFVELLDKRLPAKVVLWNPFEKIGCTAGPSCEKMLQEDGPTIAVAAGLAMRSI